MNYHGEPYRATRLWLEAVAIFRKEVPLGKHRRQWKSYDECFVAQDAISWFTAQLQSKFESCITRKQTIQLLQKFYKANIFCSVSSSCRSSSANLNSSVVKETDFKDNGQLYRLIGWNPKEVGTLKHSSNSNVESKMDLERKIPKFSVFIQQLSNDKVSSIWEQAFVDRLANIIGLDVVRAFFKPDIINGCWISHNLTQLGKYGVVLPARNQDDLPSWLVSAMKCLANWPSLHTADCGIPNYPNFEKDVFKLICEYFSMYKEGVPLLTFDLYDAFIMAFIRAELFDFNSRLYSAKTRGPTDTRAQCSTSRSRFYQQFQFPGTGCFTPAQGTGFLREEPYPFNASESVENLIMDILTPGAGRSNSRLLGNSRKKQMIPKRINLGLSDGDGTHRIEEPKGIVPKPMNENSYNISRYLPGIPRSPFFYETAFTVGSPITRLMSKTELKSSLVTLPKPETRAPARPTSIAKVPLGASSAPEDYKYVYENPTLELSASDMINHPKYCGVLKADMKCLASPSELCASYSFETSGVNWSGPSVAISRNPSASTSNIQRKIVLKPSRSQSATHLSDIGTDRSPYFPEQSRVGFRGDQVFAASQLSSSASKSVHRTLDFYYGADACIPGLMTSAGKRLAILSFRLLTLLLPPTSRRHLQLLIRCMSKMSKNEKLKLDSDNSKPTRAIVINAFFRCIMYCAEESEFDELLALRIVTFMMDNDSEIFCVKEEEGIARGVQELISAQQIIKVPVEESLKENSVECQEVFAKNDEEVIENKENLQYCSRISINEYEGQCLLGGTSKSLRNLLDTIIENPSMDDKERKKRLKQFKEEYPHIFQEKFGEGDCSILSEISTNGKMIAKKEKKSFKIFKSFRF